MLYIISPRLIYFYNRKFVSFDHLHPFCPPLPLITTRSFSVSMNSSWGGRFNRHISEIIWYWPFSVWLISLRIMLSRFIHVAPNGKFPSFLYLHNIPLFIYIHHNFFFIHSLISGHLGYFHVLTVLNNALMNMGDSNIFSR